MLAGRVGFPGRVAVLIALFRIPIKLSIVVLTLEQESSVLFDPVNGSAIRVKSLLFNWLLIASFDYFLTEVNAVIDCVSSPTNPFEIGFPEESKYAFAAAKIFALVLNLRSFATASTI